MSHIEHCLVCYGSLLPGGINHHELGAAKNGQWAACTVKARHGVVGKWRVVMLDETAEPMQAQLLISEHLPKQWPALDDFEGQAYKRSTCVAQTFGGPITAYIYEASGLPPEDE